MVSSSPLDLATLNPATQYEGSISTRLEKLFLDNVGKVVTTDLILQVLPTRKDGSRVERWHQRISELRTDHGYTIHHGRKDDPRLKNGQYLMPTTQKRQVVKR